MKAVEFCYWLQGFFEVAEANDMKVTVLRHSAVLCIRKHIDLVRQADPEHDSIFVEWLDMYLNGVEVLQSDRVEQIRRMLASQFRHVIDPSYGGDQKALNDVHGTVGGIVPEGPAYRC